MVKYGGDDIGSVVLYAAPEVTVEVAAVAPTREDTPRLYICLVVIELLFTLPDADSRRVTCRSFTASDGIGEFGHLRPWKRLFRSRRSAQTVQESPLECPLRCVSCSRDRCGADYAVLHQSS